MLRFVAEVVLGLVLAVVITFTVMGVMFMNGPWADPPGVNELFVVLLVGAIAIPAWRLRRRLRTPVTHGTNELA